MKGRGAGVTGARSSVARAQQVGTLVAVAAGAAWIAWQWPRSAALAAGGAAVLWLGYTLVLAAEFMMLRFAGREPSVPPPDWRALARAWLAETWLNALVFAWRQPFRWNAIPDHLPAADAPRRGVVLVHGFVCNRGLWNPWLAQLRQRGIPFVAVNLEPAFGSIDEYPPIIEHAVRRVIEATGLPPVLVCHSMGGLAARAWLRTAGAPERVHHVITIASPHHGTWFGHFSHVVNGRQMRLDSRWLEELQAATTQALCARFTCWYSNCDNMVFPVTTATLPGADNRLVLGRAHVELAFDPQVMQASIAKIMA